MNLDTRKLVAPPAAIRDAYRALARTGDYAELPSSIRARA